MPIQTILPPEAYQEEQPPLERVEKPCPYGLVDCIPLPDGRLRISRVISTDPAAYLDPAFAPGAILGVPRGSAPDPGSFSSHERRKGTEKKNGCAF